jgi:phospholipid/cholesterol/gamma-HCH transport system ATP-binding protein
MGDLAVIRMEHVWTRFGDTLVHQDVSLTLARGEILGIVGASGCGKTVLVREMLALQEPTEGEVWLFGERLRGIAPALEKELHNRSGVLFQGGALFSALPVFDNVAFPLREQRFLDEEWIRHLVLMKLAMVGLAPEAAMLLPAELSGGMVKRAALARALILEPELLCLDEPTSGLDPVTSEMFISLLADLHRVLGFTIVLVTHDMDTLRDLCTRVAILADQRLVACGPLEEVLACGHPFVHDFFHGKRARRVFAAGAV